MKILAVGIATLDIVNTVASYPAEDAEVRAISSEFMRGGNATNTLVALSQLGHECEWLGTWTPDAADGIVGQDLDRYKIGSDYCQLFPDAILPTSYITLNAENGSRTIIHYRNLPELAFEAFDRLEIEDFDWLHFEGRNIDVLRQMLSKTKSVGMPCSLEVEKSRQGIEDLFPMADVLLFSRHYAQDQGYKDAVELLTKLVGPGQAAICTWGDEGAWVMDLDAVPNHVPALSISHVRDTLGAGDVFNAGVIDGLVHGRSILDSARQAVALAARKCDRLGLDGISRRDLS